MPIWAVNLGRCQKTEQPDKDSTLELLSDISEVL